jgi:SAM-dependent methyltransferase
MAVISLRSRIGKILLVTTLLGLAGAAILLGPVAAFHFLPPTLTGEEAKLASVLELSPGQTVAEIGAGRGALSIALATRLQPGGTLFSTELDPKRRRQIRERAEREGVTNMVVVEAGETSTGLPDACCDAIFMRNVYHHIGDTALFNLSLRRAVRPGGRLAIIDFEPGAFWHLLRRPDSAAGVRTGHGVPTRAVVEELESAGFHVERIDCDWGGRLFMVLLRAPPWGEIGAVAHHR